MAINDDLDVLHAGHAGPGNILTIPEKRLHAHLAQAAEGCPEADRVCGCFAGLLAERDKGEAVSLIKSLYPNAICRAEPDFFAALKACPEGTDICIVAGTGSVVCSEVNGRLVKTGGRGYIIGDVGASQQYGRDAMVHFLDVGEKNISESLRTRILERFGSLNPDEVISRLYRSHAPTAMLVKLTPAVAKDFRHNEPYAIESLRRNTGGLAEIAVKHCKRWHSDKKDLRITLAGGLWKLSDLFTEQITVELKRLFDPVQIDVARISRPPVYGAALLAREA